MGKSLVSCFLRHSVYDFWGPKIFQNQNFLELWANPAGGAYSAPTDPLAGGEEGGGLAAPSPVTSPSALGPLGLAFWVSVCSWLQIWQPYRYIEYQLR